MNPSQDHLGSSIRWGSFQAGRSLTMASTSWLISGLSVSPMINSLLPAIATLPVLLPLKRKSSGYGLILIALILLLIVSYLQSTAIVEAQFLLLISFLATFLFGIGNEMSQLTIQRRIVNEKGLPVNRLRTSSELGSLSGNILTGMLFPAIRQYFPALLLLLPLGQLAYRNKQETSQVGSISQIRTEIPFNKLCALQGLVFGSLFALLALWVRSIGEGNCFDFGMLLAAYGIGRSVNRVLPTFSQTIKYPLMAALLILTQFTSGIGAAVLFVPFGALAASTDAALVESMAPMGGDAPLRWQVLIRSSSAGGLAGSLLMGMFTQIFGLNAGLPLQVFAFLAAMILVGRRTSTSLHETSA